MRINLQSGTQTIIYFSLHSSGSIARLLVLSLPHLLRQSFVPGPEEVRGRLWLPVAGEGALAVAPRAGGLREIKWESLLRFTVGIPIIGPKVYNRAE